MEPVRVRGTLFAPKMIGTRLFHHAGAIVGAVVLSLAIVVGIAKLLRGSNRLLNTIAVIVAVILHVGFAALCLYESMGISRLDALTTLDDGRLIEAYGVAAWRLGGKTTGDHVARWAFQHFGVRMAYRDPEGSPRIYEPEAADVAASERWHQLREDEKRLRPILERLAEDIGWTAYAYLFSLGGVLVFGAMGLARHAPLVSQEEKPVPASDPGPQPSDHS